MLGGGSQNLKIVICLWDFLHGVKFYRILNIQINFKMYYLKSNLKNSRILPYDVMELIYEYTDPLKSIRKRIETKDQNLNNIKDVRIIYICGLNPYKDYQVAVMLNHLYYSDESIKQQIPKRYTQKRLYKLWVKL